MTCKATNEVEGCLSRLLDLHRINGIQPNGSAGVNVWRQGASAYRRRRADERGLRNEDLVPNQHGAQDGAKVQRAIPARYEQCLCNIRHGEIVIAARLDENTCAARFARRTRNRAMLSEVGQGRQGGRSHSECTHPLCRLAASPVPERPARGAEIQGIGRVGRGAAAKTAARRHSGSDAALPLQWSSSDCLSRRLQGAPCVSCRAGIFAPAPAVSVCARLSRKPAML